MPTDPRNLHTCVRCGAVYNRHHSMPTTNYCSRACHVLARTRPTEERFWDRVQKTDGCWLWTGSTNKGYGQINLGNGTMEKTHRYALSLVIGAVPSGSSVCHTCDVRNCVRNDEAGTYEVDGVAYQRFGHLFLGTQAVNDRDKIRKGRVPYGLHHGSHTRPDRRPRGQHHGGALLSEADVREIRRLHTDGMRQIDLVAKYGIAKTTVHSIIHFKTWSHVGDSGGLD